MGAFLVHIFLAFMATAHAQVRMDMGYSKLVTAGASCTHSWNASSTAAIMVPNNSAAELNSYISASAPPGTSASTCTPKTHFWGACAIHPDPTCQSVANNSPAACPGWAQYGSSVWGCIVNGGYGTGSQDACGDWDNPTSCSGPGGPWSTIPNVDWSRITNYDGWLSSGDLSGNLWGLGCGTMYGSARHGFTGNYGAIASVYGCW